MVPAHLEARFANQRCHSCAVEDSEQVMLMGVPWAHPISGYAQESGLSVAAGWGGPMLLLCDLVWNCETCCGLRANVRM